MRGQNIILQLLIIMLFNCSLIITLAILFLLAFCKTGILFLPSLSKISPAKTGAAEPLFPALHWHNLCFHGQLLLHGENRMAFFKSEH